MVATLFPRIKNQAHRCAYRKNRNLSRGNTGTGLQTHQVASGTVSGSFPLERVRARGEMAIDKRGDPVAGNIENIDCKTDSRFVRAMATVTSPRC